MITRDVAEGIVRDFIAREFPQADGAAEIVINGSVTVERPYGWMFAATTVRYLETKDPGDGFAGLGPLLVRREDGALVEFSSAYSVESALEECDGDFGA